MTRSPEDESSDQLPAEIHADVGRYIMGFGSLEVALHLLFAQILGDSAGVSHATLARWMSFSSKLDVILDIVGCLPTSPAIKSLQDLNPQIRTVIAFRNKLAHGAYGPGKKEGEAVVVSYLVGHRNPVLTTVTAKLLEKERTELAAIVKQLKAHIKLAPGGVGPNVYHRPERGRR